MHLRVTLTYLGHKEVLTEKQLKHTAQFTVWVRSRRMSFIEGVWILSQEYLCLFLEQFREPKRRSKDIFSIL